MESESKNLSAAARVLLEKGAKLFPTNLYFVTGLANLESKEQHPERAEAILRKAYEKKPSWVFAFELARLLIEQNKIKGQGQAESFLAVLRSRGLGETFGRMLEAQIRMKVGRYGDAVGEIEAAQTIFKSQDSRINAQLNLMLAECYRRTGEAEKNLVALQNALQGGAASEADQLELARALIRSDGPGDLDSALKILQSLVVGHPELELDITRLLWQKTIRQPRDRRDWRPVEQELVKAASRLSSVKNRSESATALALLRAEVCTSQGDLEKARSVLQSAAAQDPRNPALFVALARLVQRQEGREKRR
jgi:predicted Zn-dependent protease